MVPEKICLYCQRCGTSQIVRIRASQRERASIALFPEFTPQLLRVLRSSLQPCSNCGSTYFHRLHPGARIPNWRQLPLTQKDRKFLRDLCIAPFQPPIL